MSPPRGTQHREYRVVQDKHRPPAPSLWELPSACKTELLRKRKPPQHPPLLLSEGAHGSGPPGRGEGLRAGGGQASFTARQDLLISRTNSDALGLEQICKTEWKHLDTLTISVLLDVGSHVPEFGVSCGPSWSVEMRPDPEASVSIPCRPTR